MSIMNDRSHRLAARIGLSVSEVPREEGFCSLTYVDEASPILILLDTSKHELDIVSLVTVRFYVAASIFIEGIKVGCIFIADTLPRDTFIQEDRQILIETANCISDLLLSHHRQHWQREFHSVAFPSQMLQSVKKPMMTVNQDLMAMQSIVEGQEVTQQEQLQSHADRLHESVGQLTIAIDDSIQRLLQQVRWSSPFSFPSSLSQKTSRSPGSVSRALSSESLSSLQSPESLPISWSIYMTTVYKNFFFLTCVCVYVCFLPCLSLCVNINNRRKSLVRFLCQHLPLLVHIHVVYSYMLFYWLGSVQIYILSHHALSVSLYLSIYQSLSISTTFSVLVDADVRSRRLSFSSSFSIVLCTESGE